MEKLRDWRPRYDAEVAAALKRPFKWFDHDCVLFAARVLDAQYDMGLVKYIGVNLFYDDEQSALELIEEYGSLELMVNATLHIESVPPALLTVGDIALYDRGTQTFQHALAVHDGHQLLAPAERGLTQYHLNRALVGWRPG